MGERLVVGRVLHRGRGQAGCEVIAADVDARRVVADTETADDGSWRLAVPATGGELLVFARCRGEALGIVARPLGDSAGPVELEITSVAPTHELTVRLEGDGMPDWVRPEVLLTPMEIRGLDGELLRWVHAPVREMSRIGLVQIAPEDRSLARFVQEGRWWLTARFEQVADARAENMPDPVRWVAVRATTSDGRELPPLKRGFELEVVGPVTMTIELAPAP